MVVHDILVTGVEEIASMTVYPLKLLKDSGVSNWPNATHAKASTKNIAGEMCAQAMFSEVECSCCGDALGKVGVVLLHCNRQRVAF